MHQFDPRALRVILLLALVALLQGCVAAVGAGAAAGAAVINDRRTTGTYIDDELIELKVLDAIRKDKDLWNASHINATSFNNIVLLSGETPSEALRARITEVARNIPKVKLVHNELAIAAPSSALARSSDTWITGKVKTALLNEKGLDAAHTKVVTERGVVYLMGILTRAEADVATDIARRVDGVQRVVKLMEYLE